MGGRIRALIVKELLAVWRDPKTRIILVVPPLLQLVVFAFAATQDVRNVALGVLNEDRGAVSRDLVARFAGAPTFASVQAFADLGALRRAVAAKEVLIALHIAPDFSADVLAGRPAPVQAILDGRRSNAAQIVQGYAAAIVARFADEVRGRPAPPDAIVARAWFNPNLDPRAATLPALVGIITLAMGLVVTALSVARERELGTFDQLLVSPLQPFEILVGKTVPGMIVGLIEATLITAAAVLGFGVPFRGSVVLLYAAMLVFLLAVVGFGLFISALARTQQQAILGAFTFMVPAVLLSGFATPVENMPGWLQLVADWNPLRHVLVLVRGTFLKGLGAAHVLAHLVPMAITAAVTLAAATWLFRRRLG